MVPSRRWLRPSEFSPALRQVMEGTGTASAPPRGTALPVLFARHGKAGFLRRLFGAGAV